MKSPEEIERIVHESLEKHGVEYSSIPCDPDLADTALFCERYGIPPDQSANAIIVSSKKEPKQYSANLVLATTRLDVNHMVRDLMGIKRLSFASADETVTLTGMMVGGVTPFGLPPDLAIYVDSRIMSCEWVVIGGGSRSSKIKLAPHWLEQIPTVQVIDALAKDPPEIPPPVT